jgi:diacylglycerol kinase family enzyme
MRIKYVNVYLVDQAYGGPEEGGWYFEYGLPRKSMPCTIAQLPTLRVKVAKWCEKQNRTRPPMYSVASLGVYASVVEEAPAKEWPSERPFYE